MPLNTNIQQNVKKIIKNVKPKHKKLISFGLKAYALRAYQSAACNARMVELKYSTACRKSERLLANKTIGKELVSELIKLVQIRASDIVNVDHTITNHLMTLVGALQTHNGRALPVFVESTYSNDIPSLGSQHSTPRTDKLRRARKAERKTLSFSSHITQTIRAFIDELGFTPKFAFDRGFGSKELVQFLESLGAKFYIRLKSGRLLDDGYHQVACRNIKSGDELIAIDGMTLRLVRSPRSRRCKEPWYILTNDFSSSREKIVRIYYHRFEIEETFKDVKHIFELKRVRLNKPNSLKVVLTLISIGFALLYHLRKSKVFRHFAEQRKVPKNPKKALSWVRDSWETLQYLTFEWGSNGVI